MASEGEHRAFAAQTWGAALLAAILAAGMANAADPTETERTTARALMKDGDAKREKGQMAAALESYSAADDIMHVPSTGFEVARAQAALGRLVEASDTLARVVAIPVRAHEPPAFVEARKRAQALAEELAARTPTVRVVFENETATRRFQLRLDGAVLADDLRAGPHRLDPGKHVIMARLGSSETDHEMVLREHDAKTLTLDANPAATAVIADAGVGRRPIETKTVLTFGGFGLAVVGASIGAVAGFLSMSKVDDIEEACGGTACPRERQEDIDSARTLGDVSTVAFLAGGVGAAAGIVGLLMRGGGHAASGRTGIRISPGYVGVGGRF